MKFEIFLLVVAIFDFSFAQQTSPYTWVCEQKRCLRKLKDDSNIESGRPMDICKLNCDDLGSLWPKPTGKVEIGKELVSLYPSNTSLSNPDGFPAAISDMLKESFSIFQGYMLASNPEFGQDAETLKHRLLILINVASDSIEMNLPTLDESYNLTVSTSSANGETTVEAKVDAVTFFGARHALETLSQLIAYDSDNKALQIVSTATIEDKPVFPYRGMHLDTSRNFFPLESLKRLITAMSYNKLSVFHWHITDSYSFPMEVPLRPKMTEYGAYGPGRYYTVNDMKELVAYARQRGIKIIPELDQPAHSGYGYNWGPLDGLGNLVICVESEPWYNFCVQPPCGQLNLANDNVPIVLGDIFKGMLDVFDHDVFHMGGDEVDFRCYNSSQEIRDYMAANNLDLTADGFYELWGRFQEKALGKLLEASSRQDTKILMWSSGITDPSRIEQHLDKSRYIVQIWSESSDPAIHGLLDKGYQVIFSNVDALYLDCGFPAWLGNGHNWCSPMKGWQRIYDNDPEKIYAEWVGDADAANAVRTQILGSHTALWAEQADPINLESRAWPRGAAHAERLWSHPKTSFAEAEYRMVTNRNRMVARGINADRLQPEFCLQNEGKCYAEVRQTPEDGTGNAAKISYSGLTAFIALVALRLQY